MEFQKYDMSALMDVSKGAEKEVSLTVQQAEVDKAISKRITHTKPQFFPRIMRELSLDAFWNQLIRQTDKHVIFKELAVERVLHFYEASRCSEMSLREARMGIVVCIMLSTATIERKNSRFPMISTVWGVLTPYGGVDLSEYKNLGFHPGDLEELQRIIKTFSQGIPTSRKLLNSMIGEYISNICRMWVMSDNKKIVDFMANAGNRQDILNIRNVDHDGLRSALQYRGQSTHYNYSDMILFTTPWARNKYVMLNGLARARQFSTMPS